MTPDTKSEIQGLIGRLRNLLEGDAPCLVEQFLETTFRVPGAKILAQELRQRFLETLPEEKRHEWSTIRFNRELSRYRPVRNSTMNRKFVFDVALEPQAQPTAISPDDVKCVTVRNSHFFFLRENGKWGQTSWIRLSQLGLTAAQISDVRNHSISISDLLAGRE